MADGLEDNRLGNSTTWISTKIGWPQQTKNK